MIKLSFRNKLLLSLILLPAISLSLFLWLAIDTFKEDKVKYVYDSSLALSVQLANQVRTEILASTSLVRQLLSNYDRSSGSFEKEAVASFQVEKKLSYLVVLKRNSVGAFLPETSLGRKRSTEVDRALFSDLRLERNQTIKVFPDRSGLSDLRVLARLKGTANDNLIVLFGIQLAELAGEFSTVSQRLHLLANRNGKNILGPENFKPSRRLLNQISRNANIEGTGEFDAGGKSYLISYSPVGFDELFVISAVGKKASMSAIDSILRRSLLFFLALIGATIVVGVLTSTTLTQTVSALHAATRKIGAGEFDIAIPVKSKDELGELAQSFESMAQQVRGLLLETADKARMESELLTAQTVQKTLLPAENFSNEYVEVSGFYRSASECSGDWWSYRIVDDYLYLWIGDATGHGVSAALLTSAAKTAAFLAESQRLSPAEAMTNLNRSIYEVAKGQLMMTFFAARINLKNKTMTYTNASHNPPLMIEGHHEKVKKSDLQSLMEANGSRLGHDINAQYEEEILLLKPNTKVFFFTDGLVEFINPEGDMWMERNFIKSLLRANSSFVSNEQVIEDIVADANEFRREEPLNDDMTFFQVRMS